VVDGPERWLARRWTYSDSHHGVCFFAAGFVDWTAGWCAAARHLVPVVPLAAAVALLAATKLAEHR